MPSSSPLHTFFFFVYHILLPGPGKPSRDDESTPQFKCPRTTVTPTACFSCNYVLGQAVLRSLRRKSCLAGDMTGGPSSFSSNYMTAAHASSNHSQRRNRSLPYIISACDAHCMELKRLPVLLPASGTRIPCPSNPRRIHPTRKSRKKNRETTRVSAQWHARPHRLDISHLTAFL